MKFNWERNTFYECEIKSNKWFLSSYFCCYFFCVLWIVFSGLFYRTLNANVNNIPLKYIPNRIRMRMRLDRTNAGFSVQKNDEHRTRRKTKGLNLLIKLAIRMRQDL